MDPRGWIVCGALLGAIGAGDIGQLFPDTDARYKDIDSTKLLEEVSSLLKGKGWRVVNIDSTVVCEAPKLAPHRSKMESKIAQTLGLDGAVSVKATTSERLGFTGRGEGIAAYAVAMIESV